MTPRTLLTFPLLGCVALSGLPATTARAGAADPDATLAVALTTPAPDTTLRQALTDKAAIEQTLARLEALQVTHGEELGSAYVALGSIERALGDDAAAVVAFDLALQALRIGYGLHDLRQLPIVQELVAVHDALGNWEEEDALLHFAHYLTTKNPGADADLRVQSLTQVGHWKQRAAQQRLLSETRNPVEEALELYDNELDLLLAGAAYEGRNLHLATVYLDLAALELNQAMTKYELPITEFEQQGQSSISAIECQSFRAPDGRPIQFCNAREIPNPDYYFAPSNKKSLQIRHHLDETYDAVVKAINALLEETTDSQRRGALMAEAQRLTREYTAFVEMSKKSSMYRLD